MSYKEEGTPVGIQPCWRPKYNATATSILDDQMRDFKAETSHITLARHDSQSYILTILAIRASPKYIEFLD